MSSSIIFFHPFKYQISSVLDLLTVSSQHFLQIIYSGNESSKMTSISQVLVLLAQLIGSSSIEASQTQGFSYGGSFSISRTIIPIQILISLYLWQQSLLAKSPKVDSV